MGKAGEERGKQGTARRGASLSSPRSAAARHGASARCGGDEQQRRWFGRYRGEGDDLFLKTPLTQFSFLVPFSFEKQYTFLFIWGINSLPKFMGIFLEAHNNISELTIILF